jgi:glycosyltransferase involved in cell wall biosynthesis
VYYVGGFRFPDGDAAAARVLGTGKAVRAAGARVIFGGWEKAGRPQDRQSDGSFEFDGFRYVSQADLRYTHRSLAGRVAGVALAGRNTLRWLAREATRPGDVVISYHGGTYFLWRLKRWCQARGLRLVLDCTEWYAPRQLPGGRMSPAWWDSEIRMRLLNPAVGRLMVISSYLERYYGSRRCAVLRVPPLIDLEDVKWASTGGAALAGAPLTLAYAGTPGRKDLLANVFRAMLALRAQSEAVILNLIGPTRESLVQTVPETALSLNLLGDQVVFHGRVPQSDVPRRLMSSHFTVLLRPDAQYTRAGFPTKVVESLGAGVPVITNPTGDLSLCIQDGAEGVLLDDDSPESLALGMRRLIALGPAAWLGMRLAARRRAESAFDYRRHIEQVGAFVLGTAGGTGQPA